MKRFYVHLIGDGLKGYKRTENTIEFSNFSDFSRELKRLKSNHCVLVKHYDKDLDVFEEEKKFRKVINGGTKVEWVLLDDESFLAVKFTVKGDNNVNIFFREYGFEEMAV